MSKEALHKSIEEFLRQCKKSNKELEAFLKANSNGDPFNFDECDEILYVPPEIDEKRRGCNARKNYLPSNYRLV